MDCGEKLSKGIPIEGSPYMTYTFITLVALISRPDGSNDGLELAETESKHKSCLHFCTRLPGSSAKGDASGVGLPAAGDWSCMSNQTSWFGGV